MSILIADILRVSAQLWMFSMHAAAMLFMCCSQVILFCAQQCLKAQPQTLTQHDIVSAHQGQLSWLLHLVNQGQLAVEVFFILSGMLFYNSAVGAHLMQAPRISRFAQFIITRFFRLWPIMIFCSILLLPSPMVPNRAAAPWTLLFASNHLPWNKQFMSWLWSEFLLFYLEHVLKSL
jgi:peptidoglycan/LPS O-acetylase OafA/YrhL